MKKWMKKKRISIFDIVVKFIVILLMAIVLYPLIYVLACSFSDPVAVANGDVLLLPKGFTLAGYERVFEDPNIMKGYVNTIIYTVLGTCFNLILTLPAGYALNKTQLPAMKFLMMVFMFTMYFSGGMIPSFMLIKSLGLYNTRAVLIISGGISVYNCIICKSFFAGIPKELEEAAYIDGCSVIKTFISIVLPVSKALIGVMVIYYAVSHWNSYFNAMIYTYDTDIQPLQLVLRRILVLQETMSEMVSDDLSAYAATQEQLAALIKYAVIVVSSLPVLILYPFLQKYFDKGVLIGSVKG